MTPPSHSTPLFRIYRKSLRWLMLVLLALAFPLIAETGTAGTVIVIDPGHGGSDIGTCWGGVREKNITLSIARRVENILRSRGYATVMTRRRDATISLGYRARVANQFRRSLLVSIHCNSDRYRNGRGIETYYAGRSGKRLARNIHVRMDARTSTPNRGIKSRKFCVLRETKCPAALVECGFLSSPSERRLLCNSAYQQRLAGAIADGIAASL